MVLITVYKDSISAANYNKEKNYQADYFLYDTKNKFRNIFSMNIDDLGGLHILKLCKSAGRMIIGGEFVVLNKDFVSQLISYNEPLDYHDYQAQGTPIGVENGNIVPNAKYVKEKYIDYQMELPENVYVSSVYPVMRFEDDKFFYNDFLKNGVLYFTKCNKTKRLLFDTFIQADSLEKRRFIDIPEEIYQEKVKKEELYYICLGPNKLDQNHIGITYSLPYLTIMDSTNGVLNLAYYNAPAVIIRNSTNGQKSPLVELDFNIFDEEEEFCYEHFNFSSDNNIVILNCKKLTWPIEFDAEDYMDNVELNPFCYDFYTTKNPIMAAFDINTGELTSRFGSLQLCHEKSLTGYYYTNPVSCFYNDEILFTDGYSGQLFTVANDDLNKITNHYSLFEVDTENFPPIDSLNFHTYDYVNPYHNFFYRIIEDIKLTKNKVFCLVRYGKPYTIEPHEDEYVFTEINRKNNKVKEYRLPKYSDLEILGYGLKNGNNKKVVPFLFLKKENKPFLRVF